MRLKVRSDSLSIIRSDLNKKYLKSGRRLGGSVENNNIKLYTEDDRGKHSSFFTRTFSGTVEGDILSGKFKLNLFVIVLMAVLFAVCVESIIAAIVIRHFESLVFPIVVVIFEIVYFISIKHISKENDTLILAYLEELKSEDNNSR